MGLSQLKSTVRTIATDTTLGEAARIMARDSLGALLLADSGRDDASGIITDRDIVKEIARGQDPKEATVAGFAERPLVTIGDGASRLEILEKMKMHGIRRLPIVDVSGAVTRVVSLDDLLVEMGAEMSNIGRAIQAEFGHEAADPEPDL